MFECSPLWNDYWENWSEMEVKGICNFNPSYKVVITTNESCFKVKMLQSNCFRTLSLKFNSSRKRNARILSEKILTLNRIGTFQKTDKNTKILLMTTVSMVEKEEQQKGEDNNFHIQLEGQRWGGRQEQIKRARWEKRKIWEQIWRWGWVLGWTWRKSNRRWPTKEEEALFVSTSTSRSNFKDKDEEEYENMRKNKKNNLFEV